MTMKRILKALLPIGIGIVIVAVIVTGILCSNIYIQLHSNNKLTPALLASFIEPEETVTVYIDNTNTVWDGAEFCEALPSPIDEWQAEDISLFQPKWDRKKATLSAEESLAVITFQNSETLFELTLYKEYAIAEVMDSSISYAGLFTYPNHHSLTLQDILDLKNKR